MSFIDRLLTEHSELELKISKLESFVSTISHPGDVTDIQHRLLNIQLQSMKTYNQCLIERLGLLPQN